MLWNGLMGFQAIKQNLDPRRGDGCVTTSLCFDIIIYPRCSSTGSTSSQVDSTTQQKYLNLIRSKARAMDTDTGIAAAAASDAEAPSREDPSQSIAASLCPLLLHYHWCDEAIIPPL